MSETVTNQMKDYSEGYSYGFDYPHLSVKRAKAYMPSQIKEPSKWLEGFKDGRAATGLYGKRYRG